ncbi:hypothetical protein COHA_003670 [Chlorella ohadii]|uniref:Uncharacterized protein n=1 Tax=Chlorella ohadii TaxID=2649997 RepID=A0AAD5DT85_9CHLO|nr:hypothetical protein COHA_003670 [Chlorella ohadii]
MIGARGRVALCLGLLLLASTASGRQLQAEAEHPVVGVVAPVVGTVPLERGPAPGPEGALLLTGPPILVAGTITVPVAEPGRETTTTTRGLKQAGEEAGENYAPSSEGKENGGRKLLQASAGEEAGENYAPSSEGKEGNGRKLLQASANIAPTTVAVLGAPVAESLLGGGGSGRRLQQGGSSLASQLLAPIAESLTAAQPSTGRRLQQASENSVAAQLLAPLAESLSIGQPGTGRRLQQGAGDVGGGLGVERTIPATESRGC